MAEQSFKFAIKVIVAHGLSGTDKKNHLKKRSRWEENTLIRQWNITHYIANRLSVLDKNDYYFRFWGKKLL